MKIKRIGTGGFTLIEMIASIVIIGVLATFVTMGVASIIEGYLFTKKNADTAMRTQIALTRLIKEFSSINEVNIDANESITYSYIKNGTSISDRTVELTDTTLSLGGKILAENVNNFKLSYYTSYKDDGGSDTWDSSKRIIGITLEITGASDVVSSFSTRVAPRNLNLD